MFAACRRESEVSPAAPAESRQAAPASAEGVTNYLVNGVFKGVSADGQRARIQHEEIPGYMEAMTMWFDVRPTNEMQGLSAGGSIRFRMRVTETDGWIDQIRRTAGTTGGPGITPQVPTEAASSGAESDEFSELEPGALLPDCKLTNQAGHRFALSELRGRTLAITFIFTRCPFPVYCPKMNSQFAEVQRHLSQKTGDNQWRLLSISFDSEHDAPERLADYATSRHYDLTQWDFATGESGDIRKLGAAFGLVYSLQGASFNHNLRTIVVDASGRVRRIFRGNDWTAAELAEEMTQTMNSQP